MSSQPSAMQALAKYAHAALAAFVLFLCLSLGASQGRGSVRAISRDAPNDARVKPSNENTDREDSMLEDALLEKQDDDLLGRSLGGHGQASKHLGIANRECVRRWKSPRGGAAIQMVT
ncbi:hypothetical protein MBM_02822 [Drepanopeziza brunnea f. sp. 'multigermtubi' MB_m1]|uniref:Uncharacterized protein n=1 Tax=Marssonina brunnea f. sp. multigermtubi (strain MB_m1) TaxID=1072389 RepID=K1WPP9_MARBU|nr:uncharacterized protein MBM_02822 [Drepanopeziza brunnea f. sp. 'multigermtubi' MB_m1]EKD19585.1 hypothetical protein MBM_02822 [Drepanopeziza brunnea f. sp. 'multigermtubi' MB_m1]